MSIRTTLIFSGVLLSMTLGAPSRLSREELSKVDFVKECTTESNPSNRLLYAHEEVVNSFLNVWMKFGNSRMRVTHLSNAHLLTHGGTTSEPGGWSQEDTRYSISREWGLVGDVHKAESSVYYFDASDFLGGDNALTAANDTATPRKERPADPFEAYALSQLKKGEALVRWERGDFMRALGAIRAASSCLKCHDVKEGDLLGAFTYEFEKSKVVEPDEKQPGREHRQRILQLSQEGNSLEAIARQLPGNEKLNEGKMKYYAIKRVQNQLLDAGIVTHEMLEEQTRFRKQLTENTLELELHQERLKPDVSSKGKSKKSE